MIPIANPVTHGPARLASGLPSTTPQSAQEPAAEPAESFVASSSSRFSLQEVRQRTADRAASLAAKLQNVEHVPNEVLVRLEPSAGTLADFAADYGAKVKYRFEVPAAMANKIQGELLTLSLPSNLSVAEALAAMGEDGRVAAADSNDILSRPTPVESRPATDLKPLEGEGEDPNELRPDDLVGELWGMKNSGQNEGIAGVDSKATQAWTISTGSRQGPVVAVIDSGVDYGHRDLAANIWTNPNEAEDGADTDGNGVVDDLHGFNAIDGSNDPSDQNGHGTHCAGTVGAVGNNGNGVVGVNWEAQIMPVKFLDENGSGTTEDSIKAVLYATANGARITSNSWAGSKYNQVLFDALAASPALHICAAGNEGYNNDVRPVYPASYDLDNIISVAAHDNKDRLASFSNRGEGSVDLAAPGVDIYSTEPRNKYQNLSGTSMATPHVAGVATLIATQYPQASNDDIKRRLFAGVDAMPEEYGKRLSTGGRLNAFKAMEADEVAPAQVADLSGVLVGNKAVNLNWSATGDDGMEGIANGYELRYSDRTIVEAEAGPDQISFERAVPVRLGTPKAPGEAEAIEVPLIPSGKDRQVHFALKVIDNVGNRSPLTEIAVDIPAQSVALEDDMESGADWQTEGAWALVDEPGRGKVFTDSPGGDYADETDASLTSKEFSLKEFKNSKLYLDMKHDVELKHDQAIVEVYGKGWFFRKWREVASFDGVSGGWRTHEIDLSKYDGQEDLKVRVRMKSDSSRTRDGVYVDNIVISGDPADK